MEEVARRVPLDVFHDEVIPGLGRANLEDGHDVRMVNPGREPRLIEEHLDELGVPRQVLVEPLDRVEPLKAPRAAKAREKDRPHPPARELCDELESIQLRFNHLGHGERAPKLGTQQAVEHSLTRAAGDNGRDAKRPPD